MRLPAFAVVMACSSGTHCVSARAGAALATSSAIAAKRPIFRTALSTMEENVRRKLPKTVRKSWLIDRMPCKK